MNELLNFSVTNVYFHFQTIYDFSFEEDLFAEDWELVTEEGTIHTCLGKPDFAFIEERDVLDYYVHPTGRYMIEIRYRYALDYKDVSHSISDMISIKYFDESIVPELEKNI